MQVNNIQVVQNDSTRQEIFDLGEATSMIADGPLSKAFSEALHQLHGHSYDPITGAVMETLQLDEAAVKTNWLNAKTNELIGPDSQKVGMLYGVREDAVATADINKIAETFAEMSPEQIGNSAVVIVRENDPTKEGGTSATAFIPPAATALESYVQWRGAHVYHSFEEFLRRHVC